LLHFHYQVFDGHGGKDAAHFVRDNLPRIIVEDADFPLELEKVVRRSFVHADNQFAKTTLSSGTTALTAMIFGRCFYDTLNCGFPIFE
jgi:protein phosphatase 2C family protein 2/3